METVSIPDLNVLNKVESCYWSFRPTSTPSLMLLSSNKDKGTP